LDSSSFKDPFLSRRAKPLSHDSQLFHRRMAWGGGGLDTQHKQDAGDDASLDDSRVSAQAEEAAEAPKLSSLLGTGPGAAPLPTLHDAPAVWEYDNDYGFDGQPPPAGPPESALMAHFVRAPPPP
jgi:hypothetical protein